MKVTNETAQVIELEEGDTNWDLYQLLGRNNSGHLVSIINGKIRVTNQ